MPPELTEIKRGLALWLFFFKHAWMILLQLPVLPNGQHMAFWMGRNSGHNLESGGPGTEGQGYSSSGVLEGMGFKAEPCNSSRIV